MATTRETVLMQKQILELHRQGRSERAIAKIVGKNRRTVARIIERGEAVQHIANKLNYSFDAYLKSARKTALRSKEELRSISSSETSQDLALILILHSYHAFRGMKLFY